jgi:hypothetical protein
VVYIATYLPLPVLLIDLSMNRLSTSCKHVILSVFFYGIYVFLTFLGEAIQDRPIYGKYLAYKKDFANNYDWDGIKKKNEGN